MSDALSLLKTAAPAGPPRSRWKLKVVFTNGSESRELLVLVRAGAEIYASVPGDRLHSSYHLDGRRHVASDGKRDSFGRRHPAVLVRSKKSHSDLAGVEELHVVNLRNEAYLLTDDSPYRKLSGKCSLLWPVDSCKLRANEVCQVRIGVVGSDGRAALDQHIGELTRGGDWELVQSQMHEQHAPFPYLIVLQATQENAAVRDASGWSSSSDAATLTDGQPLTFRVRRGILGDMPESPTEPAIWPPAPCANEQKVVIEVSRTAPPFARVKDDLVLSVHRDLQADPCNFRLIVNPRMQIHTYRIQNFPAVREYVGCQIAQTRVLPMNFGMVGMADGTYELNGTTYYIRCSGVGTQRELIQYRFTVAW